MKQTGLIENESMFIDLRTRPRQRPVTTIFLVEQGREPRGTFFYSNTLSNNSRQRIEHYPTYYLTLSLTELFTKNL